MSKVRCAELCVPMLEIIGFLAHLTGTACGNDDPSFSFEMIFALKVFQIDLKNYPYRHYL